MNSGDTDMNAHFFNGRNMFGEEINPSPRNDDSPEHTDISREIPFMAQILENIREVIAEDRKQRQPLILKLNEAFIFNIAKKAVLEKNSTFLMSIAGESASGKTTLVHNTAKACIKTETSNVYTVVCCDDYYKDASKELKDAGNYENLFASGFSFDTPDAVNLDLMKEHLLSLKNGEEVYSPLYDFVTCESVASGTLKKPAKLILNEGLYVLNDSLRDIVDVKIYVYTPFDIIQNRWYKRAITRGKTGAAADMQFKDVNDTAIKYIRPNMSLADVVINGMTTQEYIEEITQKFIDAIVRVTRKRNTSV